MKILLRKTRLEKGLTLRQLEGATGLSKSALSRIERGEVEPTLLEMEMIAKGLHTKITKLFDSAYK